MVVQDVGLVGQRHEPVQSGQGGAQQGRVVAVGAGGDGAQRDAAGLGHDRAFAALLAAVDRAAAGGIAAAGALVMQPSTARSSSSRPTMRS
jgi:hypothetical protein